MRPSTLRLSPLLMLPLVACAAPAADDDPASLPPPVPAPEPPAAVARLVLLAEERDDEWDRREFRLDNTSSHTIWVLSSCGTPPDACSPECSRPGRSQFTQTWTQRWNGTAFEDPEQETLMCGNGMTQHPVHPGESLFLFDLLRPEDYPCRRGVCVQWGRTADPWRFDHAQVVWGPPRNRRPPARE